MGQPTRPEVATEAAPIEQERVVLDTPPITPADNTRVAALRTSNTQSLTEAGVLPELYISGNFGVAYKNFDQIDQYKDGQISKWELNQYLKNNPDLTQEETAALRQVKDQFDNLRKVSDEDGYDFGISKDDLSDAHSMDKAMDYAQRNFDRLDGDGNGKIIGDELDAYAKARSDQLSIEDLDAIEVLKQQEGNLEEFSNDETFDENDGITRNDLMEGKRRLGTESSGANSGEAASPYGDIRPALDFAEKNFKVLDTNADGRIEDDEIDSYSREIRGKLSAQEYHQLRALRAKVGSLEEANNDESGDENSGFSMKDIGSAREQIEAMDYAQEKFDILDGDGNGHITKKEINRHIRMSGNDLSADELGKLEVLKQQEGKLEEKHNDERFDENSGFTRHDLIDGLEDLGSAGIVHSQPTEATSEDEDRPEAVDQITADDRADETASEDAERTHTVVRGDSLWKICKQELRQRNGGSEPTNADILDLVKEMARLNNMMLEQIIRPGDILKIPGITSGADASLPVPPLPVPPASMPTMRVPTVPTSRPPMPPLSLA